MAALDGTMDWDGVRVFLAVARHGSLRAAGRALGLSQPTIARRLAAFEATFGGPTLFDRLPDGARLNAAGDQLVPAAESVERAMLTLERRRAAAAPVLTGTVRVATGELCRGIPGPLPVGIGDDGTPLRHHPGAGRITTDGKPRATRGRSRLAPRTAGQRRLLRLQARHLACAVYRRRGEDTDAWVTYTEEQAHYAPARWVERQVETTGNAVALRASSMLMHVEAILAGTGRGVLPCYVGDGHPLLERLSPPIAEIAADYWMIVHRDLRRAPCVRAVIDWIRQVFAEQRELIAGEFSARTA